MCEIPWMGMTPPEQVSLGKRKPFPEAVKKALPVPPNHHRRHVVGDEPIKSIVEQSLNRLPSAEDQEDLLRSAGFDPAVHGGIQGAAEKWRHTVSHDPENLWVGPGAENSHLGSRATSASGMDLTGYPRIDPVAPDYTGPGAQYNPDVWQGPPNFSDPNMGKPIRP